MELTVNDKVVAQPTAANIEAAFDRPSFPDEWYVALDPEDGPMLDAVWQDDHFTLGYIDGKARHNAVPDPDIATIKAVMTRYLAGDPGWRDQCRWETPAETRAREKAKANTVARDARAAAITSGTAMKPAPLWQRGVALALVLVGGYVAYRVATQGLSFITDAYPNATPELVLMTGGMGIAALLLFIALHNYSKRAQDWPYVSGKITHGTITEQVDNSDNHSTRFYKPVITFAYSVDGQKFTSTQRELGAESSGSKSWAEKILAKYPVGGAVEVHYDPENPANAALENPTGRTWIAFGVAAFCFAMCVYALGVFR